MRPPFSSSLTGAWTSPRTVASTSPAPGVPGVPRLGDALRTQDGPGRRSAADALTEVGAPAVDLLIERTRDGDEQVAINAIDALGNTGRSAARAEPALRAALNAENPWL